MKTIYHFNSILKKPFNLAEQSSMATKKYVIFAVFCLLFLNVGHVNAQNNPSAIFDVASTSKGILVPRMTAAQRSPGIANPATGLLVYQTDGAAGFYYNAGTPASPNWVGIATLGSVFFINTVNPDTQVTTQVPIPYTPSNVVTIMPSACTCTAIYLEDETFTPAGASSCTATLFKNNVATPLTVTVTSSVTQGNKVIGSATGSVAVAAGDKLTIGVSSTDPTKYIKMNVSLNCK